MSHSPTRRTAVQALTLGTAAQLDAAWQHAHESAAKPVNKLEYFSPEEAAEVEALTSEIIPTTETPGAREAGVIYFIDRALATWEQGKRPAYQAGMAEAQALRRKLFPSSQNLASLKPAEVQQVLRGIENGAFFGLLRAHTALGFLGSPSHGGNRGGVGWAHIGYEDRMGFQPPFGYYDAEAMKEGK